MAVQRNFVVRNGLEVNTSLVFTDTDNQRVGIGSTQPTTNLDVKLGGIAGTDLYMAGLSTFMNDLDCNASVVISAGASVAGFTTFTNIVQTGSGAQLVSEHQSLSHQAILQFIAEMSLSDTGCLSAALPRLMVTYLDANWTHHL